MILLDLKHASLSWYLSFWYNQQCKMNTCTPDARYAHRDDNGNLVYHMSDNAYEEWSSSTGRECRHEDIDKNPNYVHVYNDL